MQSRERKIQRGDIYYADLTPTIGSEQGGIRPVLILQNNIGNKFSPTVIVAALTSKDGKRELPTHVDVGQEDGGLFKRSVILLEQLRTLDHSRLSAYMGTLTEERLEAVDRALLVSLGLGRDCR